MEEAPAVLSLERDVAWIDDPSVEFVIGVDEAGRGCMAGPVAVAAVCFRVPRGDSREVAHEHRSSVSAEPLSCAPSPLLPRPLPANIQDSKVMKPSDRAEAFTALVSSLDVNTTMTAATALDAVVKKGGVHVFSVPQHHRAMREPEVYEDTGKAARTADALPHAAELLGFAVTLVEVEVIDRINILNATLEGMSEVCAGLVQHLREEMSSRTGTKACTSGGGSGDFDLRPDNTLVLIDGNRTPWHFLTPQKQAALKAKASKTGKTAALGKVHAPLDGLRCRTAVGGDGMLYSVAAASVVAKVSRDTYAERVMHAQFPLYGFDAHKGYVTALHKERLAKHGLCAYHRTSYAPVIAALAAAGEAGASGGPAGKTEGGKQRGKRAASSDGRPANEISRRRRK